MRLGLSKDVPLVVMPPCYCWHYARNYKAQLDAWQQQFQQQLPVWLAHGLSELSTEIIVPLLQSGTVEPLTVQEQQDLLAFTEHHRSPDHCWPSVLRAMQVHSAELQLPEMLAALLFSSGFGKVRIGRGWRSNISWQGKSRGAAITAAIKQLLLPHGGEKSSERAGRAELFLFIRKVLVASIWACQSQTRFDHISKFKLLLWIFGVISCFCSCSVSMHAHHTTVDHRHDLSFYR